MRTALLFAAVALSAAPALAKSKPPKSPRPPQAQVAPRPDEKKPGEAPPAAPPASTPPATKPGVAEAVARMQKFYESTSDLHAKFEQELVASIGGTKKASGDVWLKKPGRMRWEYAKPEKKLMVADGA